MAIIVQVTVTDTDTGAKLEGQREGNGNWNATLRNRHGKVRDTFEARDAGFLKQSVIKSLRTVGVFGLQAYELAEDYAEKVGH